MLPRDRRITEKSDFDSIREKGEMNQSFSFGLCVLPTSSDKVSRFGFIVSSTISKDAVARNKAKRALRQAVRQNLSFIKNGFDCVFLAKPVIVRKYTADIMKEVRDSLSKAGII